MGFVLVQHLDPMRESSLTGLLARATSLPVREVTNDLRVQPNHVYVIPPNANLSIANGILKLQRRTETKGAHRSVDFFFESLAQDQHECAIGVILSGTATDGTLGLEAIKAEGGITFAQDESAKYDSMPRSAIAAGCVDFVLSPQNIAKELAHIAQHPLVARPARGVDEAGRGVPTAPETLDLSERRGGDTAPCLSRKEDGFKKVLLLLRNHTSVDFSLYKSTTIQRRVNRRMVLNKVTSLESYAKFLRGNAKELEALYSDVLISVTSFFRNPEAFEFLKHKVFPQILPERRNEPLRIWVLGCSTGQEAYSLAMAFTEFSDGIARAPKLQIFATDLNAALLEKARVGLYARGLVQDLSPERLRRFFIEADGGYRVIKPLREAVVFAQQNLLRDPPFSRMDLIACRNLLIYLEPRLQQRAMPTFHYALKPKGFLFLGASESVGAFTNLFEAVDKKLKIYARKPGPSPPLSLHDGPRNADRKKEIGALRPPGGPEGLRPEINIQREADRVALNRYAPTGVLVDAELQVLQFRGDTSPYLKPPTGQASFNVLKMAREGLMLPLRTALNKAKKENKVVRKESVHVDQNGKGHTANIQIMPLKNLRERCYLIFFEGGRTAKQEVPSAPVPERPRPASKKEESRHIAELESELSETRDYLQSFQEQYEAANEELQASNEEVTSANEELQSVNEELETSKEELESANEELTTVNEEMANRNTELNRLNSDLVNLQTSTHLAIVLLGRDLSIRRFSTQAEKQFNLLATDAGRPFANVRHNLDLPDLEQVIATVIETVRESEREVRNKEGRWYLLRVRPYMTLDNKIDGAVLVLVDIDALKRTEAEITEAREYADAIIRTTRDPLLVLNADLRLHSANEAFYKTFKAAPGESEGRLIYELGNGQWNIPRLRELLEDILPRNSFFNSLEITHDFESIGRRIMLLNARKLGGANGRPAKILVGIQDITEILHLEATTRRSEVRYRRLFEAAKDGVLIMDPETRKVIDANPFMTELLGYSREELLGKELFEIGLLKDEEASHAAFGELEEKGFIRYDDLPLETREGHRREVEMVSNLYQEDGEKIIQCNVREITERKLGERALRESENRYRALFDLGPIAIYSCDASGVIREFNHRAVELWGRAPAHRDTDERFCGSFKLRRPDGSFMAHADCPMAEVLCGKIPLTHDGEVIIERPDGLQITVIVNIRPLKNEQGEITGAINCFYDVTERKRSEEARARLAAIVESSDDAIISKSLEGVITSWNAGAERLFGYRPEEIIGQPVMTLIPPDHHDEEREILERLRRGEHIEHLETVRLLKNGQCIDVSLAISPIRDEAGRIIGASKIARDITGRKRIERELHKARGQLQDHAQHLETLVEERTAALRETVHELEAFSYSIAHDLRAPLRAMNGFAQLLTESHASHLDDRGRDYLQRISTGAARLDTLIQEVLNYTHIVRAQTELARIDLDKLVRDIIRTQPDCQPERVEIQIEGTLPAVLGQVGLLTQCVSNLLGNAIKFVAPGVMPRIRIWAEPSTLNSQPSTKVLFQDNGIGIAPEHHDRIFRMFERIRPAAEYEGTGMGLTIVRKAVERMHGKLDFESEPGRGTTFWIELRRAEG